MRDIYVTESVEQLGNWCGYSVLDNSFYGL